MKKDFVDQINNYNTSIDSKIDGAIACIMALDRAIRNGNANSESVYDSRGLIVL